MLGLESLSKSTACFNGFLIKSKFSPAPLGLPGKLTIMVCPRIPQTGLQFVLDILRIKSNT